MNGTARFCAMRPVSQGRRREADQAGACVEPVALAPLCRPGVRLPRIDIVVALLFVAIPLVALALRANVAYPIVLVLGGLILGFIPGLPVPQLPPDVVLLVFLPPLLYWEALTAPAGAIRENAGLVRTLVIGLVLLTTAGVAAVAHAIVPGMPWAAAFVLGAVVSPTDAVAFSPVAERRGVPPRLIAIVQAEGLLNDASALVIYASAVAAVVSGQFVLWQTALSFVISVAGAIALGLAIGVIVGSISRRMSDPDLQTAISILAPFLGYLPATAAHISGVLAVVTTGLYMNRFAPDAMTPQARVRSTGFWRTVAFLMNVLIFLIVGLQLHGVLGALAGYSRLRLVEMALAVSAAVIAIRFVWIFGQRYVVRLPYRIAGDGEAEWKYRLIVSWSGFRGGVSLAAALAIPNLIDDGSAFPQRGIIVFLTFGVILVTLVGQGLTLPWLMRGLRLSTGDEDEKQIQLTIRALSDVALDRLRVLEHERDIGPEAVKLLRQRYQYRRARYDAGISGDVATDELRGYEEAGQELIAAQRRELLALHRRNTIDSTTMQHVETALDLEELYIERLVLADVSRSGDA